MDIYSLYSSNIARIQISSYHTSGRLLLNWTLLSVLRAAQRLNVTEGGRELCISSRDLEVDEIEGGGNEVHGGRQERRDGVGWGGVWRGLEPLGC